MTAKNVKQEINKLRNHDKAVVCARFFKTNKGEYGDGDKFLGLTVPEQRLIAKQFLNIDFSEIKILLDSKYHEHRLTGSLILVEQYKMGDDKLKKKIFDFYYKNSPAFNNWDLIDLTAYKILGNYLLNQNNKSDKDYKTDRQLLYTLARSENLWSRRMAIVSTFAFIRANKFTDTIKLAIILLNDKHDLMHKAVGWMLREVGKRDKLVLIKFLNKHIKQMPRTMLRYAIEKFPEEERQFYLKK